LFWASYKDNHQVGPMGHSRPILASPSDSLEPGSYLFVIHSIQLHAPRLTIPAKVLWVAEHEQQFNYGDELLKISVETDIEGIAWEWESADHHMPPLENAVWKHVPAEERIHPIFHKR
jgi:hypothetical protein